MKITTYFLILFLSFILTNASAQIDSSIVNPVRTKRTLTVEPAIGIKPWPTSDILFSTVLQWNFTKRFALISYSSYSYNNAFSRNFNFIKTNYNYTLSQKAGIGGTLFSKHSSHTFSLIAGIKYDAFKETLSNPEFENFTSASTSISPDMGLMYNLKIGAKKYFFSYRMYVPLTPYPIQTKDINSIDGNFAGLSLEFGIGVRIN